MEKKYLHDLFGGEANIGDISEYVILINDPLAVDKLGEALQHTKLVADHYEFRLLNGTWQGVEITLCSIGIGGGSASIAMESLAALGAKTLLNIGTVTTGERENSGNAIWVAAGAVRLDGASLDYAKVDYPAVTDAKLFQSIVQAAKELKIPLRAGIFLANAAPLSASCEESLRRYNQGIDNSRSTFGNPIIPSHPEIGTVITLANLYRLASGALQQFVQDEEDIEAAQKQCFQVALRTMKQLYEWQKVESKYGLKMVTPPIPLLEGKR